jgi:HD superfamily phosphohydrolase
VLRFKNRIEGQQMSTQIVRKIRENMYGSIGISGLEDQVLAHSAFQRLRRIKQTAFLSFVFPGATHTRFEHSLGVMHIAGKAWRRLEENQNRFQAVCENFKDFSLRERRKTALENHGTIFETFDKTEIIFQDKYVYQSLRLAAMLHDVGHPPFSHSGEIFLPPYSALLLENPQLPAYIKEYFSSMEALNQKTSHEDYTIMLVYQILNDIQSDVDPQDVVSIICPKIQPKANSPLQTNKLHILCHQLISGEIDVDRMDYLRRDSQESGVVYGVFDIDRILDSLSLYYEKSTDSLHLAIRYSGLAAFEDFLRARQSMYFQVYSHKTTVAVDVMLRWVRNKLPMFFLPASVSEYIKIDEWNLEEKLFSHAEKNILTNGPDHVRIVETIKNIFFQRKIWKRVFEISNQNDPDPKEIVEAKEILKSRGVLFEHIKFCVQLTKFKKRDHGKSSSNEIRLIKKDASQFPRVLPIEDYSRIVSDESKVFIERIYVDINTTDSMFKEDISNGKVFLSMDL